MRGGWGALGLGLGLAGLASPAQAAEALHVGVLAHNVCLQNCDSAEREEGPAIEMQLDFQSPAALNVILSPTPYLIASINVAGETSYAGAGLDWDWRVGEDWSLLAGVGYVIHDGETELPYASGTPEAAAFSAEHVLLGSRDLWRLSLGVTRDLPGPWAAEVEVVHLSHGQILGSGRNQGLDQLGLRVKYEFD